MRLNDLAIKRAKPGAKLIKLSDGGGLQLWITPGGAKRWRLAYRFDGAQRVLAIGVYPAVHRRADASHFRVIEAAVGQRERRHFRWVDLRGRQGRTSSVF